MIGPTAVQLTRSVEWADDGLIAEAMLYRATAVLLGVAAVGFLVWTLRAPASRRRFGFVAVALSAVVAVSYLGMSLGVLRFESLAGEAVPVTRFVGYLASVTGLLWVLTQISGGGRTLFALLEITFLGFIAGTLGSWFLAEPFSIVASVSTLLTFGIVAYLLLVPGTRAVVETTGDRILLYGKLRNLLLLAWAGYLVVAIISRQNLGLLDGFVGVFIGTYIDVLLYIGFGVILLRHGTAIDQVVDGGTTVADDADGEPDSPNASAAD